MTDCRECRYCVPSYSALLCTAMNMPKPIEYMRDDRSECGLEGRMYEPKQKKRYAEFEDD